MQSKLFYAISRLLCNTHSSRCSFCLHSAVVTQENLNSYFHIKYILYFKAAMWLTAKWTDLWFPQLQWASSFNSLLYFPCRYRVCLKLSQQGFAVRSFIGKVIWYWLCSSCFPFHRIRSNWLYAIHYAFCAWKKCICLNLMCSMRMTIQVMICKAFQWLMHRFRIFLLWFMGYAIVCTNHKPQSCMRCKASL